MRLWSIHPKYLDAKGLTALWREALLARNVLKGGITGYRNHPQLIRFKEQKDPMKAINSYLYHVYREGVRRGYDFDRSKVGRFMASARIPVKEGQLRFEFKHLKRKLEARSPQKHRELARVKAPKPHPLFKAVKGRKEKWEKA